MQNKRGKMKIKGINHFEYTRGLIVASIMWLGIILFMITLDVISDLLEWAFGTHWLRPVLFILFVIIGAMLLGRIGILSFNKLTRNRFRYFSTEKIKKVLNGGNENVIRNRI